MEQKKIFDYFDDEIDYPENIAANILPYGTLWNYVSCTFLNGFINYVNIITGFVIDRYSKREGKAELIDETIKKATRTDLRIFKDDVVILSRIGRGKYMFFYFDYDVSDCMIGRFETNDGDAAIVQSIIKWLELCKVQHAGYTMTEHTESGILDYMPLPVEFFKRWISY